MESHDLLFVRKGLLEQSVVILRENVIRPRRLVAKIESSCWYEMLFGYRYVGRSRDEAFRGPSQ